MPTLDGEPTHVDGMRLRAELPRPLDTFDTPPPPVLLAALGPAMLRLAGEHADGTVTLMSGVRTVAEHIVATISVAAAAAGRPAPRIVVGLPICVTADVEAARHGAGRSSRRGSRSKVLDRLDGLCEAGVSGFLAWVFGKKSS